MATRLDSLFGLENGLGGRSHFRPLKDQIYDTIDAHFALRVLPRTR